MIGFFKKIRDTFHSLTPARRDEVFTELERTSSPGFDYFLMVVLSCSIATFGLVTDSSAPDVPHPGDISRYDWR
jgi:hypothetical protein